MNTTNLTLEKFEEFYNTFEEVMKSSFSHYTPDTLRHYLEIDYSEEELQKNVEEKTRQIYIALDSGKIVGFLVANNTYAGIGFASWLGIKEGYRKKGYGKELTVMYEKYCKDKLAHKIELWCRDELLTFYEKLGFTKLAHRTNSWFGMEHNYMEKELGEWNPKYLENALKKFDEEKEKEKNK